MWLAIDVDYWAQPPMVADLLKSHTHNRKSCNVHPTTTQPQPHMIIT